LEDFSDEQIQTPMFFPTIDIQPVASAYIRAMTELNIWGQITLMRRNVEARRSHLISLAGTTIREIENLEQVEFDLKRDTEDLEVALQYYKQVEETLRNKKREVDGLRRNVDELRQHPGITAKSSGTSILQRGSGTPLPSHSLKSQSRSDSQEPKFSTATTTLRDSLALLKSHQKRRFEIEESDASSDDSIPDTSGAGKAQGVKSGRVNNEVKEDVEPTVNEN
jgi:hypothetical protein